ncbi:RHS repeat-associated core domain-containing protein [Pseudomonas jessenii]|uniref:RHS repeat-associated core domain-containing protein n=1 Tax=Pseudomonas jessenii TaxID=77298 RepID=UPI0032E40F44
MSQPVDQDNRSLPRVVLLATDRSQSIIGEIVDGQTKTIAYSAYGEQSAQQRVETRLGFNGQLREANIGWYLLGNGYRTYNPKLMRFHSPDSWSPFRGGGVECVYVLRGGSGESGGSDRACPTFSLVTAPITQIRFPSRRVSFRRS